MIVWTLKKLQRRSCEETNKLGKYLAYQLKKSMISKITAEGKVIINTKEIRKAFKIFYSKLYQERPIDSKELEEYLQKVEYREISEEQQKILKGFISKEEIIEALNTTKF